LHSGKNLATAFTEVLKAYGIQDKVWKKRNINNTYLLLQ
jgi:hypothetical protein